MAGLQTYRDENLLVGYEGSEDAGVYALSEEIALVESVDFITPILDEPYLFGQIAAANALSDIFAMGAVPKTALNLLMWDQDHLPLEMIKEILKGGALKLNEAKVTLLGGHTIADREQKYGLSVTGIVHPREIWRNQTARLGDVVILTKPIGSGILATALKNDKLTLDPKADVIVSMTKLNAKASQRAREFDIHACTDVTGFGLVGHLLEMCGGGQGLEIFTEKVPLFDGVKACIAQGLIPNGSRENHRALSEKVQTDLSFDRQIAYFDTQTSGGLLLALPRSQADGLLHILKQEGYEESAIIGEFTLRKGKTITLF